MRRLLSTVALTGLFLSVPLVVPAQAAGEEATYIVTFNDGVVAETQAPQTLPLRSRAQTTILSHVTQGAITRLTASEAAALAKNPRVATVQRDQEIAAHEVQTPAPWHLDRIDGRENWHDNRYTYPNKGAGVTVYVIDSGIDRTHREFAGVTVEPGIDLVQGEIKPGCQRHGTAVSSMVAGATYGVAKEVTIVPVRVLNCEGKGTASDFWQAADWIMAHRAPAAPAVVNISLGNFGNHLNKPTKAMIDRGLVVVTSAGNDGVDACRQTPGSLPEVITVGATDIRDREAGWSNYGSCVDLYAPGVDVPAALDGEPGTSRFGPISGTSFAAPMVSGAAAQVLAQHPRWSQEQVWNDIKLRATGGLVVEARSVNRLLNVGELGAFAGSAPVITGSTAIGSQLSVTLNWKPEPTAISYQWLRNGVPIPGATGPRYTTVTEDLNQQLTIRVGGSRQGYDSVQAVSDPFIPTTAAIAGTYRALSPVRVLDTRQQGGAVKDGSVVELKVAGRNGVPSGAAAAVVNLTVVEPQAAGYLTAYAQGGEAPVASNVNFVAGKTRSNLAVVPLSADGRIALRFASPATAHLVADIQGYVVGGQAQAPGTVQLLRPTRLLDTRESQAVPAGGDLKLPVAGKAGLPAAVSAVILNVTAVDAGAAGYVTAYPGGERPTASNLNFVAGQTVPNLVLVKVGPDGVVLHNGAATPLHLVADIQGYVIDGQAAASGAVVAMTPTRVLDTRSDGGPVQGQQKRTVPVLDRAKVAGQAPAAILNLTVTDNQAPGYLTAYPSDTAMPTVSNVNVADPGSVVANLAFATLNRRSADLFWGSPGTAQVVADVSGYVLP